MTVKIVKPISNATRRMSSDDFSDITAKKPSKSLLRSLKKKAGRNGQGKITIRHRGGGAKRKYRIIDFKMLEEFTGKVISIEYDPNRNARIAQIETENNRKFYMVAPIGLKVGSKVASGAKTEVRPGNRMKLANIPVGTVIYNVELIPGKGGQLARSAGTGIQISGKEGRFATLKLPSGELRLVEDSCMASIGTVSNPEHANIKIGKAGRKRHMGIRPTVRGKVMNPVDHPHGGGEGSNDIGLPSPKTPWGKPALGLKTRNRKARSNKMIIRRRKG